MSLFRRIILRHLRHEWGRLLLAVLGVAIGVAVFLAIRLANTTILDAFSASLDEVAGLANLQAVSNNGLGFDERYLSRLRSVRGVKAAAPVVEQYAQVDDSSEQSNPGTGTPVLVFGVDILAESNVRSYSFTRKPGSADGNGGGLAFLRDKDAIIITSKLSEETGAGVGDTIALIVAGRRIVFRVADIVRPTGTASVLGGNFALLDIASAQEAFGRIGKLDRVDLVVDESDRDAMQEFLVSSAPPNIAIREPASRGAQVNRMLGAFDLNLTALAFIAFFVAMFIIYNTMLTSTLRRRRELGILRALGASRRRIVLLFLSEAGLIGLLGAIVGVPLGIVLSRLALEQVTRTVSALYLLTVVDEVTLDPVVLAVGAALGIIFSVVSALPAALEAARAHPRETFSLQTFEARASRSVKWIALATPVVLLSAWGAATLSTEFMSPLLGFASAGLLLVGVALVTPVVVSMGLRFLRKPIRRIFGVTGELAAAWLLASTARASTAIAALMTAIAMLIGVSTMVDSFRRTVDYWLRGTIMADLYITPSSNRISATSVATVPPELLEFADSLPQAAWVDAIRRTRVDYNGTTISVGGGRFNLPQGLSSLAFRDGEFPGVIADLKSGDNVAVSEGFALRHGREIGDTIVLTTPSGPYSLTIAGVYYDYASDGGGVILYNPLYARLFGDSSFSNVGLYLRDTAQSAEVRSAIERRFGARYSMLIYSNGALRQEALIVFDQTFAITYALQFVAIVVAAIGVANTLAAMVVERAREIGILKAIGGTPSQIYRMVLVQAALIGGASQLLGIIAGLGLSAILIYVINRVSFGWTIRMMISPEVIAVSSVLVVATAVLAGLLPAGVAARRSVADAVQTE